MRFVLAVLCLTLAPVICHAAEKVAPTVADAFTPAPSGKVQFSGRLGTEIETCRQGRIFAQSIPDLIQPFTQRTEEHLWQSEFWGKWFTSAALAYRDQPDPKLRAILDEAVTGLIKTQTPDGYIGNYKPSAETKGWDVWGRKYVLLGLIAYYDLTGERAALDAAVKEADYTISQLGPGKTDIVTCGMWTGMAASSILEPMVLLYRETGDQKYLDFANYIVTDWDTAKGPGLVTKARAGMHVYDMFANPDPKQKGYMAGGQSKAYEMMSCYEGLLELYRVTGKPEYLEAVRKVQADILSTEITVIGSGSSWERWCSGKVRQTKPVPEWMETCVTATWLKLNAQLLRMTGESQYADQIEWTMYNSLIAAQESNGAWWCHYNPLDGGRKAAPEQCKMHMNCCVANGPRALMLLPTLAMMTDHQGVVVNFYEATDATLPLAAGQSVNVKVHGDYPRSNMVDLTVNPSAPAEFTLSLRIPAWSTSTQVIVAGQDVPAVACGGYLRLRRTWRRGDSIHITFDFATHLLADPGSADHVALVRGPVVLTLDRRITQPTASECKASVVADASGIVAVTEVRQEPTSSMYLTVDVPMKTADGKTTTLRMCDYASAGHTWDAQSTLRVWLPQPINLAEPFGGQLLMDKR